jgi:hypothetical protein
MSRLTQNRWFRRFGFGAIAVLSLAASPMLTNVAQAHEYGHRAPVIEHHVSHVPWFFTGWHHPYHGGRYWR